MIRKGGEGGVQEEEEGRREEMERGKEGRERDAGLKE